MCIPQSPSCNHALQAVRNCEENPPLFFACFWKARWNWNVRLTRFSVTLYPDTKWHWTSHLQYCTKNSERDSKSWMKQEKKNARTSALCVRRMEKKRKTQSAGWFQMLLFLCWMKAKILFSNKEVRKAIPGFSTRGQQRKFSHLQDARKSFATLFTAEPKWRKEWKTEANFFVWTGDNLRKKMWRWRWTKQSLVPTSFVVSWMKCLARAWMATSAECFWRTERQYTVRFLSSVPTHTHTHTDPTQSKRE